MSKNEIERVTRTSFPRTMELDECERAWLTELLPYLFTMTPQCVALTVPRRVSFQRVLDVIAHGLSERSAAWDAPSMDMLNLETKHTVATAEGHMSAEPGSMVVTLQLHDPYLFAESKTLRLWRCAVQHGMPMLIVMEREEWQELPERLQRDALPEEAVIIDLQRPVPQEDVSECMEEAARALEAFHRVRIPADVVADAFRRSNDAPEGRQLEHGRALLDLWAVRARFEGHSSVSVGGEKQTTPRYMGLIRDLTRKVRGQDEAIRALASQVCLGRNGLRLRSDRPSSAVLLTGTTGTGKTLLARTLAESLNVPLVRVDMAALGSDHLGATLLGAPPGYVGSNNQGQWLTSRLKQHPRGVLLLDEVDKAARDVWMPMLLELLGAGTLTDYSGTTVDVSGYDVILTSNIGAQEMTSQHTGFGEGTPKRERVKHAVRSMMPPEVYNRLDAIVIMEPLDEERMNGILDDALQQAIERAQSHGQHVELSDEQREVLLERALRWPDGARRLHREIERMVFMPLLETVDG